MPDGSGQRRHWRAAPTGAQSFESLSLTTLPPTRCLRVAALEEPIDGQARMRLWRCGRAPRPRRPSGPPLALRIHAGGEHPAVDHDALARHVARSKAMSVTSEGFLRSWWALAGETATGFKKGKTRWVVALTQPAWWKNKLARKKDSAAERESGLSIPRRRGPLRFTGPVQNHVELVRRRAFIAPDHEEPLAVRRGLVV